MLWCLLLAIAFEPCGHTGNSAQTEAQVLETEAHSCFPAVQGLAAASEICFRTVVKKCQAPGHWGLAQGNTVYQRVNP